MTLQKAIEILEAHNKWRKGEETQQQSPKEIGEAIDTILEAVKGKVQTKVTSKQEKLLMRFFEYVKEEMPTYRTRDINTDLAVQHFIIHNQNKP